MLRPQAPTKPGTPAADVALRASTTLPGVGPALAATLQRLGLTTLQDLWFHLPLRYEDKTHITPIRDLHAGDTAQVEGRIEAVEKGFRYRPQLRVAISDDSRQTLLLRFFHFSNAQAIQLTQYQKSYQAVAKMISVLDSVTQATIDMVQ